MEEDILLKLENVEICREENRVLHDACLTLRNGEFVYVIGKVGSGKSSPPQVLYCEIPDHARRGTYHGLQPHQMKRKVSLYFAYGGNQVSTSKLFNS